jgi:hypothetical protein
VVIEVRAATAADVERLVARLDRESEVAQGVCVEAERLLEECLTAFRAGGRTTAASSVATVSD